MIRRSVPDYTARRISNEALHRAASIPDRELPLWLDNLGMGLNQSLDDWRYNGSNGTEVILALDAFMALWNEAEQRGLANT